MSELTEESKSRWNMGKGGGVGVVSGVGRREPVMLVFLSISSALEEYC